MAKINVLPKSIAELIAAGEVCERPASVVKELVENSVDAGADKITVEIRSGGNRYIRITDNGCGIDREDVPSAFLSHATSKIRESADLDAIYTLGFRGEALASVCAVSKTEMLTRTKDEEFGTRYIIEGADEVLLDDAGCPQGTTIVVRDLFYNTPARMKFLKKDVTEGNYVSDTVTKAALSHPEISFRLIKDDKQTLFTPGNGSLTDSVSAIFGKEFSEGLIPCSYELNGVKVTGLVSKPLCSRPNRNMQHFFVNMRYVKIPFAAAALDQAYKNSIMAGKFPAAVLFIGVPQNTVDVNVHPAKTEVRFSDEKRVFEAVFYAAKNVLSRGDSRPKMNIPARQEIKKYQSFLQNQQQNRQITMDLSPGLNINFPASSPPEQKTANEKQLLNNEAVSYIPQEIAKNIPQRQSVRDESAEYTPDGGENAASLINTFPVLEKQTVETQAVEARPLEYSGQADISEENLHTRALRANLRIAGEMFKTYIIAEYGDKMLIIDKHAAHERLIFNRLKADGHKQYPQILLSPVNVTLSKKEYAAVIENLDLLAQAGFSLSDFGEGSVLVRECPEGIAYEDIKDLICELAGYLCSHVKEIFAEKLDWIYHSAACRAALKAGDKTNDAELEALVWDILKNADVMYCPHGRPVLVEMTRKELEKQFGR